MYMYVSLGWRAMYKCLWVPVEGGEAVGSSRTGVTGGSEPSSVGAEEPNSGPLKEQQVLLTSKPSLQPQLVVPLMPLLVTF